MIQDTVVYQPDNCLKHGYAGLAREIFSEIFANRWLTTQLLKRDLVAMYKQSIAGFLWLLINPLVSVATFVILSRSGVFSIGDVKIPYAIYAVLGMSFWQLFAAGLVTSASSLVNAGSMISKINFSKKSLVFASVGASLLSFIIQFILVLVLFVVYRTAPSPMIFLTPLLALPMIALSLGLGFIVSLLNAVLRDVGAAIPVLMNFLLFLTPVLYARKLGIAGTLASYNPLYYLVSVPRDIIINGKTDHLAGYLIAAAISFFVFVICLSIFHLTESRVAERI